MLHRLGTNDEPIATLACYIEETIRWNASIEAYQTADAAGRATDEIKSLIVRD
jgi:hypothetical protein